MAPQEVSKLGGKLTTSLLLHPAAEGDEGSEPLVDWRRGRKGLGDGQT